MTRAIYTVFARFPLSDVFVADIRHLLEELVFGATVLSDSVRKRAPRDGHGRMSHFGRLGRKFVPPMLLP